MEYTFQDAFAEILPRDVPEYFSSTVGGELEFAVPGWNVTTKDYLVKLALGEAPLSDNLNIRRVTSGLDNTGRGAFNSAMYLAERGDSRVYDWATWVANEKWGEDSERRSAQNAVDVQDLGATQGIDRIKMQNVMRLVILKVMYENDIDVFVNPEHTLAPRKIGGPTDPVMNSRNPSLGAATGFTALMGTPQIVVPAGYNQIIYEPRFVLNDAKTNYISVAGTEETMLPVPMPISMMLWSGPGDEPALIKTASAYEAATQHRIPPPDFGPLTDD